MSLLKTYISLQCVCVCVLCHYCYEPDASFNLIMNSQTRPPTPSFFVECERASEQLEAISCKQVEGKQESQQGSKPASQPARKQTSQPASQSASQPASQQGSKKRCRFAESSADVVQGLYRTPAL